MLKICFTRIVIMNNKISNNPKVSVLLTIYNVEKYLEECLDSIIDQTYSNIEIVCVNNGSLDLCADILEKYKKQDNRIKVITLKENKKLCTGRNVSLDHATGELLMFVDPDDVIGSKYIESFVSEYYKNIDKHDGLVINPNTYNFASNNKIINNLELKNIKYEDLGKNLKKLNNIIYKNDLDFYPSTELMIPMWGRLYKTSIIKTNNIRFVDGEMIDNLPFTAYCSHYMNKWFCMRLTSDPDARYYRRVNQIGLTDEVLEDPSGCGTITSSVLFNSIYIVECLEKWIKYTPEFIIPVSEVFFTTFSRHKFKPFLFNAFKEFIRDNKGYFISNSYRYDNLTLNLINAIIASQFYEFFNFIYPNLFQDFCNQYKINEIKSKKSDTKSINKQIKKVSYISKKVLYFFKVIEIVKIKVYPEYVKYFIFGLPVIKKIKEDNSTWISFLGIKIFKIQC